MANKEKTKNSNYSASIIETSRELTAKERVMYKDTKNAISFLEIAEKAHGAGEKAIINNITDYIVIEIHNESSDDVDYKNYVVLDAEGNKYVTGSQSFWNAFMDIYSEMSNETEPWGIELVLLESKNYKGKNVLTCSLI